MYVHIKVVAYVTFPSKQYFQSKLIRQKYTRNCQTRIYSYRMPLWCVCCTTLPIEYGFRPCFLKNAERKENYQNTRIVNEHMVS